MPNRNFATPTTAAPTQKLIYNAQGQLAELRDASNVTIARYVYRGDGKRAWKELADGTRSYSYYAGDKLIVGTNGNNLSSLRLWGADGLIGSRTFNSTTNTVSKLYNLYDPQGNLAQIVDADSGNVVNQSAVSAWGEPLRDSVGNTSGGGYGAKFGYVRDGESGFYLCTLRYYDPSAGRWITRDPIGYAGGSNLYGYVSNDPVNLTDPMGLDDVYIHQQPGGVGQGNHARIWVPDPNTKNASGGVWYGFWPSGSTEKGSSLNPWSRYDPGMIKANDNPTPGWRKTDRWIKITITPQQAKELRSRIRKSILDHKHYDLSKYNCSSWSADMLRPLITSIPQKVRTPKQLVDALNDAGDDFYPDLHEPDIAPPKPNTGKK